MLLCRDDADITPVRDTELLVAEALLNKYESEHESLLMIEHEFHLYYMLYMLLFWMTSHGANEKKHAHIRTTQCTFQRTHSFGIDSFLIFTCV